MFVSILLRKGDKHGPSNVLHVEGCISSRSMMVGESANEVKGGVIFVDGAFAEVGGQQDGPAAVGCDGYPLVNRGGAGRQNLGQCTQGAPPTGDCAIFADEDER